MIDKLLQEGQLAESFSMLQAEETYSKLADYVDTMKNNADLAIKVCACSYSSCLNDWLSKT